MCQAPLSLLHSACLVLLLLILLLILFLHHLKVEDTGNEHVEERAYDRSDYDPEVGQDIYAEILSRVNSRWEEGELSTMKVRTKSR